MSFFSRLLGRSPSRRFWQCVANHPDEALDWFKNEECWKVVQNPQWAGFMGDSAQGFVGPFKLKIPRLEWQTVFIFGELDPAGGHSLIEDSQRRFMQLYENL